MNRPTNIHSPTNASPWRTKLVAGLLLTLMAMPPLAVGEEPVAPPILEAQRLDGSRYALTDSRGIVTVVVVWSPESLASRKSLGELQRFTTLHPQGEVKVIAVSTLDAPAQLRHFANERQLALPLAIIGKTNLGPFPEPILPQVFVFDRNASCTARTAGCSAANPGRTRRATALTAASWRRAKPFPRGPR